MLRSNQSQTQDSFEKPKNPEGHNNLVHRRNKYRKNKKEKPFDKHLEIAPRGINKAKDKEQGHEKTKENLERLLEEETLEELVKAAQVYTSKVVIHNHHNGRFHGQKSNLDQLRQNGIRAQGDKDEQQQKPNSSPNIITPNFEGSLFQTDVSQEKNDYMEKVDILWWHQCIIVYKGFSPPALCFMINQNLSFLFWNYRGASSKASFRIF